MSDFASIWLRTSAPAAMELLLRQNGEAKALKIARLERDKARRARSRKRYDFWTAVSQEMELAARLKADGDRANGQPESDPRG